LLGSDEARGGRAARLIGDRMARRTKFALLLHAASASRSTTLFWDSRRDGAPSSISGSMIE
jgi:hypothetical protein